MLPVKAPVGRAKVEHGHTRGSIPYAVVQHALKEGTTVVITKGADTDRLAAEVELWVKALSSKPTPFPLRKGGEDFTGAVPPVAPPEEIEHEEERLAYRSSAVTHKVVVLPGLPKVEEEDEDEALWLQRQEKNVELLGVLGEIGAVGDENDERNNKEKNIKNKNAVIIIGDIEAITQPLPGNLENIILKKGEKVNLDLLKNKLGHELGYSHETMCEGPGQYALRGGVVDIYPPNLEMPVRVDFFGEEIEAIRTFDPTTQRSEASLTEVKLSTARAGGDWQSGGLKNYLSEKTKWILIEPADIEAAHAQEFSILEKIKMPAGHFSEFVKRENDEWLGLMRINRPGNFLEDIGADDTHEVKVETPAKYRPLPTAGLIGEERAHAEREMLEKFVEKAKEWGAQSYVFARGELATEHVKALKPLKGKIIQGAVSEGFIMYQKAKTFDVEKNKKEEKIILSLAPGDLPPYASVYSIARHSRKVARRSAVNELLDFSMVAEGDFLVHLEHGICRYRGIGKMDDGEEVLSLEFDEGVVLHLRFGEAHLISRYVGLSKKKPRLNRLGSAGWAKAKSNAKKATLDFAAELLRLQAARVAVPGFAFGAETDLERHFDGTFPYRLTTDQAKAIEATKGDMIKPAPMDRLVCGDVGFGKTEVALRAAMKAVAAGKQVAILCPTTILSQQHFNNFNERAAGFGVVVECLNRFRTASEERRILKEMADGRINVIVGTHRLLSRDVIFKDLGLIVIDEEHRFGVEQKEQLKRLRVSVDILAMSATPIPRTLQMALGGARDLSIIETAPQNRRPIETIVKTFDEKILKEAIDYEVERGGQVFYLHNRVRTIARVALRLQEMFPKLRVAIGHGQMNEEELEQVMTDFIAGKYDILVCTTIIESGLDIPNCNTLIIEGADQFGLAQLYQIRGRVGRFNRQAYAYLFLNKKKDTSEDARERLEALRVHNELGAGFRIAMRDLELRGSGNLLGPQQSGHVVGIGFELYCELLKESVEKLKAGAKGKTYVGRTSVRLDFKMDTTVPTSYLPEARLRLELHRELSQCETVKEVKELKESIIDRFGKTPESVENLLKLTELRAMAHEKGLILVSTEGDRLMLMRADGSYVKIGALFPRIEAGTLDKRLAAVRAFVKNLQ